ncbi:MULTISPECIES: DEAD/DEAH box helicase [unclassified Bradyrhizobium]|uniref:DEAD/DEAH box helicase n=1 Tax=unclassified Bradyrhizobium TaxID=2631580 RepID=UPI002478BFE4|nr:MULTISPECIES: DEAD/DEAH box helicase [unclassified Bradyrhizobium]WGS18956.1 DEAD/DEAH box helicase [Bradyrhizobium sp. ISRA463]WGS25789.1 DEAD/DEAH box helicase [Bradyrhizobium sp. ISRA464]
MSALFAPGDLVYARGREWVALPSPADETLCLRPLAGAESDVQVIHPALEREPVRPARFALPTSEEISTQEGARLLSQALRLSLRRGAGPFRSAARLSFEPRAYQLVPLLMALRLDVVRLLIADDVGIGKTIEAALILRELIDRGEADRFAILCPPHLVEQWTGELNAKFDLDAVSVTAASAARLERGLPASQTLFDAHPYTVVSLDYIKADRRRDSFARSCPALVIVDEAHACVGTHQSRHQRFELLKRLAEDKARHLILLTATPHSGDEAAFDRLLGLLDPAFSQGALESEQGRTKLARHFVQRRRIDITGRDWGEDRAFPKHDTAEQAYELTPAHKAFHDAVLDYCLGVVESAGASQNRRRLAFWGTLALMRCVGSSPAAAASALRNRLAADPDRLEGQVFDEDSDESDAVDVEPTSGLEQDGPLEALVVQAERLGKAPDPKFNAVAKLLKPLVDEGANPVIFCRFIATAEHVASALRKIFPELRIEAVTGELTSEERRERVEAMVGAEQRLLVATDCLSEGINLQNLFDTVIHYDLSWNPTRHQQREGRVDRFGQPAKLVRSVLLFSPDSAIDGAVLEVILRKAEQIRKATGVTVPLPDERGAVTGALMNAVLLRKGRSQQLSLDLGLAGDAKEMETIWRDAEEGERRSRARFAQNTIRPEEVKPEWQRWRDLLGGPDEVRRFVERAMSRLDAALDNGKNGTVRAHISALPAAVRERLSLRGLEGTVQIAFDEPAPSGAEMISRSHPLPATLAETLLESALDPSSGPLPSLGRAGVWPTPAVKTVTTVAALRLRYKLIVHGRRERMLLAEEAVMIAWDSGGNTRLLTAKEIATLLDQPASADLAEIARKRLIAKALEQTPAMLEGPITIHVRERAKALENDHARVRAAASGSPRVTVEPVLPADVIGLYVLAPAGH